MANGSSQTEDRLANLRNLEPLLSSMRILALRTVQITLNRLKNLESYRANFSQYLDQNESSESEFDGGRSEDPRTKIVPSFFMNTHSSNGPLAPTEKRTGKLRLGFSGPSESGAPKLPGRRDPRSLVIVFGSEAGLCGGYDRPLLKMLEGRIEIEDGGPLDVEIAGAKMLSRLKKPLFHFRSLGSLSRNGNPNYVALNARVWDIIQRFESGEFTTVELISYRKTDSGGGYEPSLTVFLPDALEFGMLLNMVDDGVSHLPIIEGNPMNVASELQRNLAVIRMYTFFLESIAAENQARFRLLEEARENTTRLIDELQLTAQLERRQTMTQEILDLAVSAGLVQ